MFFLPKVKSGEKDKEKGGKEVSIESDALFERKNKPFLYNTLIKKSVSPWTKIPCSG